MECPNNIYVVEYKGNTDWGNQTTFRVLVIAASTIEVAKNHVKDKIGINADPVLLPAAKFPTIWTRDGSEPEKIQAKILTHSRVFFKE